MSDQTIRLVFQTQYLENYGAHCWDGEGECLSGGKPKGGAYIVPCTPERRSRMSSGTMPSRMALLVATTTNRSMSLGARWSMSLTLMSQTMLSFGKSPHLCSCLHRW